jgi:hypothetical protein
VDYLRGLLPPAMLSWELQICFLHHLFLYCAFGSVDGFTQGYACILPQEKRLLHNVRQFEVPLQYYMALMDLQVRTSISPDEILVSW